MQVLQKLSIDAAEKQILQAGTISKVEISSKHQKWLVHFGLADLVSRNTLHCIESAIAKEIGDQVSVRIIPHFDLGLSDAQTLLLKIWPEIVLALKYQHPALTGWLGQIQWKISTKDLVVTLPNELCKNFFLSKKVDNFLQRMLVVEFGVELRVVLEVAAQEIEADINWLAEYEQERVKAIMEATQQKSPQDKSKGSDAPAPQISNDGVILGKVIKGEAGLLQNVQDEEKNMIIQGRIFNIEVRELRTGRKLVTFDITDLTDSLTVKFFEDEKMDNPASALLKKGMWLKARGPVQYDRFSQELTMMAYDLNKAEFTGGRRDTAEHKRVELHVHTKMSSMDGIVSAEELVKRAKDWGHPAIAITDHGVVQAFPEAADAGEKYGVKIIYGVEGYLINDGAPIVLNPRDEEITAVEYVVFDLETTGLSPVTNEIIEIGAVKIHQGQIIDRYNTFVRPTRPIPPEVVELTGITQDMVQDAPAIHEILPIFHQFTGDAVLVAHNAVFDTGFLRMALTKHMQTSLVNPTLDTLGLARALLPHLKNHKLNTVAKELGVGLENHHRAVDDALATGQILLKLLDKLIEQEISLISAINGLVAQMGTAHLRSNHIIILVENMVGLTNLYKLITKSHLEYYHRQPRIPKSELSKHREGLIIGSACEAGELIRAYLDGAPEEKLEEIARFYDYLEVQPCGNNQFMLKKGQARDWSDLQAINRKVIELGDKLQLPVVATGDVHFMDPDDEVYRRILMAGKGFDDADDQAPLHFRTTQEMMQEFDYLSSEKVFEIVVTNPNKIAERVEVLKPMPDGLYPPKIEGAEQQIHDMTYNTAREIYGEDLPEVVQKRIDKELNSIINNGFSVLYLIAQKLVKKSNDDGYLVGSRGSVGSSFVATMTGITEVNPLPPHYVCCQCKYSEFIEDGSFGSGADMPNKECPQCGQPLKKDGHDIPFEVFLGFKGDKVPDIDLNFSGDYQPRAHKYTEELFGTGYVFRAGTIGTIAEKTAYGFVKNYLDERNSIKRNAEMNRLVEGCTGVKRTTGQHPGGVMVVPRDMDVHDFTPLQHPADDSKSGIITTHFDYHSISGRIVKLDILGHDDPTVIKMLEDLTGLDAKTIPLDEPHVLKLFSDTESLRVTPEDIRSVTGTYGVPEFGTKFVRQMLEDTKPKTFSELVRISGFSHGTDVWLNNAQDLIKAGTCQLSEAISARDDIMVYLIYAGLEPSRAFKIMEGVRKGKGVKPEDVDEMHKNNVPEWYIESCQKIKYMFPKAHAVAYVMMAFRIAYFKVHYPEAFYATYFTVRADEFDADIICQGEHAVLSKIEELEAKGNTATNKEKNLLTILELALEMYKRGISIARVDLEQSDAVKFKIIGEKLLLPPFAGLQGLGDNAAKNLVAAREEGPFISVDDLRVRARLSKTVIEILQNHGCLRGMAASAQMELFG